MFQHKHEIGFRGRIDPVEVLDRQNQRLLLTTIEHQVSQGGKRPVFQRLWCELGQLLRAVLTPQEPEQIRRICFRVHPDLLQHLAHFRGDNRRGIILRHAAEAPQEIGHCGVGDRLSIGQAMSC